MPIYDSLNFILFALELMLIQPNVDFTPEYPENKVLLKIYQRDLDLFETLIEESKSQLIFLPENEGNITNK